MPLFQLFSQRSRGVRSQDDMTPSPGRLRRIAASGAGLVAIGAGAGAAGRGQAPPAAPPAHRQVEPARPADEQVVPPEKPGDVESGSASAIAGAAAPATILDPNVRPIDLPT